MVVEDEEEPMLCTKCGSEMEMVLYSAASFTMFTDDDGDDQIRNDNPDEEDAQTIWLCDCGNKVPA